MEQTSAIYKVPDVNMDVLTQKIAKLNKRAKKLGCEEIQVEVSLSPEDNEFQFQRINDPEVIQWHRKDAPVMKNPRYLELFKHTGKIRTFKRVKVTGEAPKYNGWKLVGVLEPMVMDDHSTENMVKNVPGCEVDLDFRNQPGVCDHCNTRRQRNETFVVENDVYEQLMVGRSCLKDFLGHKDPHALTSMAEILWEMDDLCKNAGNDDWLEGYGHRQDCWDLERFLAVTAAIIRKEGWMSKSRCVEGGSPPTASLVSYFFNPPAKTFLRSSEQEWLDDIDLKSHEESILQTVERTLEWAKNLSEEKINSGNYFYNLNLIARYGFVTVKNAGIAASMLVAAQRELDMELEDKKPKRESNWVGEPKERITIKVQVTNLYRSENAYGSLGIHRMEDEHGNVLTWFASGTTEWLDDGEWYTITCRVKDHTTYKERKQTIVTHVKAKAVEAETK